MTTPSFQNNPEGYSCLPHALPRLPLPPRLLRYLQLDFEDVLY